MSSCITSDIQLIDMQSQITLLDHMLSLKADRLKDWKMEHAAAEVSNKMTQSTLRMSVCGRDQSTGLTFEGAVWVGANVLPKRISKGF